MNKQFFKSVGVLVGGTAGAQLTMLLAAPILTRLYTPADFGILAIYTSLLAIFSIVANLRYEVAIPLPHYKVVAVNLAAVASLIAMIVSLFSLCVIYLFIQLLSDKLNASHITIFLWFLPLAILLTGLQQVLSNFSVREKQFKMLSSSRVFLGLVTVSIQLAAFSFEVLGLLLGQIIGLLVSTLFLAVAVLRMEMIKAVSPFRMLSVVRRYSRFPKFSVWDGLSNTAGTNLPTVLIVSSFGASAGGIYSMTLRVLVFPVTLIGAAVGQVFLSDAPQAHRENRLSQLVLRLTEIMLGLSLPFMFLAFLFGPEVFALIFGNAWRESGEFAKWLSPWIILTFVYSPLSSVFSVLKLEKTVMKLQFIFLILRLGVIFIGISAGDLLTTVILFGILNFIYYFFLICRVLSLLQISLYNFLIGKFTQLAILSFIALLTWYYSDQFTGHELYRLCLILLSIVLAYFYIKKTTIIINTINA